MAAKPWFLYLLECSNGAYYAGIATNVAARFLAHQQGKGARYTRANPPVKLLAQLQYPNRSEASKAEWALKQLPRELKIGFFSSGDKVSHRTSIVSS